MSRAASAFTTPPLTEGLERAAGAANPSQSFFSTADQACTPPMHVCMLACPPTRTHARPHVHVHTRACMRTHAHAHAWQACTHNAHAHVARAHVHNRIHCVVRCSTVQHGMAWHGMYEHMDIVSCKHADPPAPLVKQRTAQLGILFHLIDTGNQGEVSRL